MPRNTGSPAGHCQSQAQALASAENYLRRVIEFVSDFLEIIANVYHDQWGGVITLRFYS